MILLPMMLASAVSLFSLSLANPADVTPVQITTNRTPASRVVERWEALGRGEIDGELVRYSIDATWPTTRRPRRTSHWQIIFDQTRPDGTKEFRFVDYVDCDREVRAASIVERYGETGQLLHRRIVLPADLLWESIANDSLEARADGFACVDGPEVKSATGKAKG